MEGTASWVDDEHKVLDEESTWDDLRDGLLSAIANDTPTLRSAEKANSTWQYTLGQLATDQLTANTAPDFPIEFWRQLSSTGIGPHGRWASTPDWRTALHRMSGRAASEFYADFDIWRREQAAANAATGSSYEYDGKWIRGRVTSEGSVPVAGAFVNATRVEGETSVGWKQRAEAGADGSFAVRAPEAGDYRLSVDINDDCTRYYSHGELAAEKEGAQHVQVAGADARGIEIQAPANVCGWQIRGRVVGQDGAPLAGLSVRACQIRGGECSWGDRTAFDGLFEVTAEKTGDYRLSLDLADGCAVYFRAAGVALSSDDAAPISIAGAAVDGLTLRVPDNVCQLRLAGALSGVDRFVDRWLHASLCRLNSRGSCEMWTGRDIANDGAFAVAAPSGGSYRLSYRLDGCEVYYSPTGLTSSAGAAAAIAIGERNVRIAHRHIPTNVCAHQVRGTIIGADGQPLASAWVSACERAGDGCASSTGGRTDEDGMFAITVPVDGAYRISFGLDGCSVYFGQDSLTSNVDEAQSFRVDGRDIQLSQRQVPAGMCAYRITGSIAQADGQPLADAGVSACVEVDGVCVIYRYSRTDGSGAFAITVPEEGMYGISFSFKGCGVHFRRGGLTTNPNEKGTVTISGRDVRLNPRQIPEGMCPYRISGRFVDSGGTPLSERQFTAHGTGGGRTDPDGHFEIRVPSDGAYTFGIELRSQPYCWHDLARQALGSWNNPIRVNGADVNDITLRLPGTIEELCE